MEKTDPLAARVAPLVPELRSTHPADKQLAIAQLSSLGALAVPWLLAALQAESDTSARINLGAVLANIGRPAWGPLLASAQASDDRGYGWSVAWALSKFVDICDVDDFLAALHHPNVHVRWATALALKHFPDAYVVAALVDALSEDGPAPSPGSGEISVENYYSKVRNCAAQSLRHLGPVAFQALLTALQSDNPLVRAGAADALTGMQDARAFAPLSRATIDVDPLVRRQAIQALAALIPALTPDAQVELAARHILIRALREPDKYAQTAAAKGLCAIGESAVAPLLDLVQDSRLDAKHPYTRMYALHTLACLLAKDPPISGLKAQAFLLLVNMLREQTNSPRVRRAAAETLEKTKDARVVQPLVAALTDPNPYTRQAVVKALKTLGDRSVLPALQAAAQALDADVNALEGEADGVAAENEAEAYEDLRWLLEEAIAALTDADALP